MKISKCDALAWLSFFAELPEGEELLPKQYELGLAAISQIERAVDAKRSAALAQIPQVKSLAGRTLYVGEDERFPRGCRSCLLGTGLSAVRKTNRCNAACRFCYDYGALEAQPAVGEGFWEIGGTRFREEDLPLLLSMPNRPTGISYVYLEPFMEIEKYYGVIRAFHEAGIYQHMYTNGINANEENLRALGEAGLDELRFNLGASGCSDRVIDAMATAKRFIPMVGIETPMTPELEQAFLAKKERILSTGIDFMNCAELHLNPNNIGNYEGEPMYMTRLGYLSPIWSRDISIRMLARAAEEHWPITVHDCSNHTKFARDLNLRAKEGGWFGASSWACEFDSMPWAAFLPVLQDPDFTFVEEEPLPVGYRPGDIVL